MVHTHFKKVLVLPDAGIKNPFQYQMIQMLRSNGLDVVVGKKHMVFTICRAVRKSGPEVLYLDWVHSFILGKSIFTSLIKSFTFFAEIIYIYYLKQIPIVHTLHNIKNHNLRFLFWERVMYRFLINHCERIRVYSEAVKQEISERFKFDDAKIFVIQDIPFHHYYPNVISREESRKMYGFSEKAFLYLFFGRIERYKGLQNLISSFCQMAGPDDYLLIAGESLEEEYLLELKSLSDKCPAILWYHQFIEKEAVQCFFNMADVTVLPFTRIDHSGSVDLAMSFGKAIITRRTESSAALLALQDFLLFSDPSELTARMIRARQSDLAAIGNQNFKIADSTNYFDLLTLFRKEL